VGFAHIKILPLQEQLKMSQSRVAGTRTEFLSGWKEWAREINRLAYQSDDNATMMTAIDLRIQVLALIDEIAGQIYPVADLPGDFDMTPFSPISRAKETDDQSAD
jgi:hypothetical protein